MPATATLTEKLDSGVSIDESDLAAAPRDELEAVAVRADYPESLRDAALLAIVRQHEAERLEDHYADLKLRDRVSPGRTPWQTLRRKAEADLVAKIRGEVARTEKARTTYIGVNLVDERVVGIAIDPDLIRDAYVITGRHAGDGTTILIDAEGDSTYNGRRAAQIALATDGPIGLGWTFKAEPTR